MLSRVPVRLRHALRLPLALAAAPLVGSCWPGWDFLFDTTPSREHRVEDARVLAVVLEPASLVFTPAYLKDGGDPVTLRVQPAIFDPRGGDIDVDISLCVGAGDGFSACEGVAAIDPVRLTVTANPDDRAAPLGRVDVDETLTLTHAQILALFDTAGVAPTQVGGIRAAVVVNIGATFDGKRERERAELFFAVEVDPYGEGTNPALFTDSGALDCSPITGVDNDGCVRTDGPLPECGNGVIDLGEQCDPPGEGACQEGCFTEDFCQAATTPVCVFDSVVANQRPTISGLDVDDDFAFPLNAPETVAPGGVIALTPGEPRFIFPTTIDLLAVESAQSVFADTFCPEGSPGRTPRLECGETQELLSGRVYIADGRAELFSPTNLDSVFTGNPLFEPVGVSFTADTPPGTTEPLVLVLADGVGGMELATFTLEAR